MDRKKETRSHQDNEGDQGKKEVTKIKPNTCKQQGARTEGRKQERSERMREVWAVWRAAKGNDMELILNPFFKEKIPIIIKTLIIGNLSLSSLFA